MLASLGVQQWCIRLPAVLRGVQRCTYASLPSWSVSYVTEMSTSWGIQGVEYPQNKPLPKGEIVLKEQRNPTQRVLLYKETQNITTPHSLIKTVHSRTFPTPRLYRREGGYSCQFMTERWVYSRLVIPVLTRKCGLCPNPALNQGVRGRVWAAL